jgi:hypothetical protein
VPKVGVGTGIGIDSFPALVAVFDRYPGDVTARIDANRSRRLRAPALIG